MSVGQRGNLSFLPISLLRRQGKQNNPLLLREKENMKKQAVKMSAFFIILKILIS